MNPASEFGSRGGEAGMYQDQSAGHVHQPSGQTTFRPPPQYQSQAQTQTAAPASNVHQTQAQILSRPLDLGFIPGASSSQTSLLEAVVGSAPSAPARTLPVPPRQTQAPSAFNARTNAPKGQGIGSSIRRDSNEEDRSFGTSTEREWDVMSDASSKLNEGDPQAVEELQKKVNKRRSNLPQLENELAALEAQIKAAEERIARAQSGGVVQPGQRI